MKIMKRKMKLTEVWKDLKEEYQNTVVLIQYGNFFRVFEEDSYIIYGLMNYRIIDGRVGFPISEVEKVKNQLEECRVNYYFFGRIHLQKDFEDNKYHYLVDTFKLQHYQEQLLDELKNYSCIQELEELLDKLQ